MYWKMEDNKVAKTFKNEIPQEELIQKMEKSILTK